MVTTDDVLAVVARCPWNFGAERGAWLDEQLAALGAPDGEVITAALAAAGADDRNLRVRALWALWRFPDPWATAAVLAGLRDPVRRVREVAMKCVRPHHATPAVVGALRAIVDDEQETNRLRRQAFFVLASSVVRGAVPEVAEETLRSLMDSERFRAPVLLRLCTTGEHSPAAREVLREFVRSGSKEEAVMATRALCGHRLMRVDAWLPAELRQRVREQYDPAPDVYGGVPLYWLPVADAAALAAEVGVPGAP
jgi:hypothetical protein